MAKEIQDLVAIAPALDLGPWNHVRQVHAKRPQVTLSPKRFYGSDNWKRAARSALRYHFKGESPRTRPLFTTRSVASSGNLVKSSRLMSQWKNASREVAAVEMELSGVYVAARRRQKEYPIVAIRGISDIVGFRREIEWTAYACATAASFAISLLRNLPPHFLIPHEATRSSGSSPEKSSLTEATLVFDLSLQFHRNRWFFRDRPILRQHGRQIIEIAKWAQENDRCDLFLLVLPALREYCDLTGLWAERKDFTSTGLLFAERCGNHESRIGSLVAQAWLLSGQGHTDAAMSHVNAAIRIARKASLPLWECEAMAMEAVVLRRRRDHAAAIRSCQNALRVASRLQGKGRTHASAWIRYELGLNARDIGALDKMNQELMAARRVLRVDKLGNPSFNVEFAWLVHAALGFVAETKGDYQQAEAIYMQSLAFFSQGGSRSHVASILLRLANLSRHLGKMSDAIRNAEEAREIGRVLQSARILLAADAILNDGRT